MRKGRLGDSKMKYKYITKTFTDSAGVRHYVRGKTLEEAIIKREELKRKLAAGEAVRNSTMLFKAWADIALDTYKPNVSPRYMTQIRNRLDKHILPFIGQMPIGRIEPIECQRIMNSVSGMSHSMITKLAQELRFYFDTARKNNMIPKNPAEDLIRPTGYSNKRRSLTPEERAAFLKVSAKYDRFILFELMLYCGCRPAEAAGVKYEDVVTIDGIPFLHIRGTKTANSDRLVPLPKELQPRLCKPSLCGLCATTAAHTHHNESSYKRLVSRLKREMNIAMGAKLHRNKIVVEVLSDDFVPYLFRHTYCTDLKKMGVDVRIAKDLMGHADIRTTANIYDHADGDTLMLAAKQMGLVANDVTTTVASA